MADMTIDEAIENFQEAIYGKDVRNGLVAVAETVKEAVENQLITVDSTLTESGQGADAKAVGDAIDGLDNKIDQITVGGVDAVVEQWLDEHPEATTTIQDGAITDAKLSSSLKAKLRLITLDELETVGEGTYTLGTVDVNSPINFPRLINRGIIIVNTVFNINVPVLFPSYDENQYFGIPCFVGCTFNNSLGSRVLISSGKQVVGSRFTGCNFFNVDCSESTYNQDFNFVNCYIQSYQAFLKSTYTTQARFVNCDVEADSKVLVDCQKALLYFSGTYEGNASKSYYFVNAMYGAITFDTCWFESAKLLKLTGGTVANQHTHVNFKGCEIFITSTPVIEVTNPQYVHVMIDGCNLSPADGSALFVNRTASEFYSVQGAFISNAKNYVKPFGGVNADDRDFAVLKDVQDHFKYYQCALPVSTIESGGIDLTDIPIGQYLVMVSRGSGMIAQQACSLYAVGGSLESNTIATVLPLIPSTDDYLSHAVLTPTKASASDTVFSINVNMDSTSHPVTLNVALLKMY